MDTLTGSSSHSHQHQDWIPVVVRKKKQPSQINTQVDPTFARLKRLENEEIPSLHVNKAFGNKVMQIRIKHGMTKQSDLAARIGEKPDVIQKIERGIIPPSTQPILTKINRVLKLEGDDFLRLPKPVVPPRSA